MSGSDPIAGVIESPEGAVFSAEQDLFDAGDPDARLAVTVHFQDETSYCNFWQCTGGQWRRIIPERVLEMQPMPDMLMGEYIRLLGHSELVRRFEGDMRLRLGLTGLTACANLVAEGGSEAGDPT